MIILSQVRKNVIFERARFNCRNQLKGEPAEQYITELLYRLVETCEYGELTPEMIRRPISYWYSRLSSLDFQNAYKWTLNFGKSQEANMPK